MKYKHVVSIITCSLLFLIILFAKHNSLFHYRFTKSAIPLYDRSQDIPHEVKDRIFLSDSDIHIASGYLYANGNDPTSYNFQHPPLIKYLFGYSIRLFQTPYVIQILLGILYIMITYLFAWKLTKNYSIASATILFMAVDPVFHDVASQALLDLGQSVLSLLFVIISLYFPASLLIQGIVFGLFAASKFWSTSLFFFVAVYVYAYITTKKIDIKSVSKVLLISFITFCVVYLDSFIHHKGAFNIIFFQLKILKYWFHQSLSSMPAASLLLFMTGYVKSWWGSRGWVWTTPWTFLWPVSFIAAIYVCLQKKSKKEVTFAALLPLVFLIYLGAQAPFTRYFVIILPYLYICLSIILLKFTSALLQKCKRSIQ